MPLLNSKNPWQPLLGEAIQAYLAQPAIRSTIDESHILETPDRVVKAFEYYMGGSLLDPAEVLKKRFSTKKYDQMISVHDVPIKSMCAHHLCPIWGKATFAYIPKDYIVGLSKISRMIKILSRRLQVQEDLTDQIVDVFQDTVTPAGCAVHIRAFHFCMLHRGVEDHETVTQTKALRGCFKRNSDTRKEFIAMLPSQLTFP